MDINVQFYAADTAAELRYAVVAARCGGQWVLSRHRERGTGELPGGHREPGEDIDAAARRELYEETGAELFTLSRICVYSVTEGGRTDYGMLYFAEIDMLGELPESEIAERRLFELLPGAACTRGYAAATGAICSRSARRTRATRTCGSVPAARRSPETTA